MMRRPVIIAVVLVLLCLSVAVAQVNEPPLPPNLKIMPPGAGVSPHLAQLSGIWEGAWEYRAPAGGGRLKLFTMDTAVDAMGRGLKIAIIAINPPNVEAIYATGGSESMPGKFFRVRDASVSGDDIILKWGQPGKNKTLTLHPSGNPGVAHATLKFEHSAHVLHVTLRKK
jgi:hypothetical protein